MGDTPYDDLHADDTSVSENPLVGRLERELASLRAEKQRAEAERDDAIADATAVRELMNCYNLGGWTDSVSVMQRALKAEAERDAALKDAERYRFLRHNSGFSIMELLFGEQSMRSHTDAKLDAAIDTEIAAIAARKGEQ